MPYTGNYEITLSGTQGSAYSNNSGGAGYTLTKSVRLKYEDVIKVELPERPSYKIEGDTISVVRGNSAKLYINDEKIWEAAGGTGLVNDQIAPDDINWVQTPTKRYSVHWHSGNGLSGPKHSNSFPTIYSYTSPGGCYRGYHTHDALRACPWRYTYHSHSGCSYTERDTVVCDSRGNGWSYFHCTACGRHMSHYDGGASSGWGYGYCGCEASRSYNCDGTPNAGHEFTCGGSPINTWSLGCNKSQGEIEGINNAIETPGTCYYNTSAQNSVEFGTTSNFTPDSAVLNNNAAGKFSIKLLEQDLMYNAGVSYKDDNGVMHRVTDAVRTWHYDNGKGEKGRCNFVLVDNVVTYFKRR